MFTTTCPFCQQSVEFDPNQLQNRFASPEDACEHWERVNPVGLFVSVWFKEDDQPQVALAEPTDLPGPNHSNDRGNLGRS